MIYSFSFDILVVFLHTFIYEHFFVINANCFLLLFFRVFITVIFCFYLFRKQTVSSSKNSLIALNKHILNFGFDILFAFSYKKQLQNYYFFFFFAFTYFTYWFCLSRSIVLYFFIYRFSFFLPNFFTILLIYPDTTKFNFNLVLFRF